MLRVRAFHPLRTGFPARFPSHVFFPRRGPTTPARPRPNRFGLCRFRSPLLAVSLLFSLPQGTKMFQFPWFAPACAGGRPSAFRVAPFGYPRINSYLPIPAAFRSLSRPSSPPRASGIRRPPFSRFSRFACLHSHEGGARSVLLYLLCFSTLLSNMSMIS